MRQLSRLSKVSLVLALAAVAQGAMWLHARRPAPKPLATGERLARLDLLQENVPVRLDLGATPACTYVVFLIPSCPTCQRTAPRWAREFGRPGAPPAVGVSFAAWDSTQAFVRAHDIRIPVFASGSLRAVQASLDSRVLSVPTIALVGRDGRVGALGTGETYSLDAMADSAGCPRPGAGTS